MYKDSPVDRDSGWHVIKSLLKYKLNNQMFSNGTASDSLVNHPWSSLENQEALSEVAQGVI